MKITARIEYACVALLELAARYTAREWVPLRDIAERHGIPASFLVQILLQLKAHGLVESTRGVNGGYRLQRPPADISLWDVCTSMDATANPLGDSDTLGNDCALRTVRQAWGRVYQQQKRLLCQSKIDGMLAEWMTESEPMYHI